MAATSPCSKLTREVRRPQGQVAIARKRRGISVSHKLHFWPLRRVATPLDDSVRHKPPKNYSGTGCGRVPLEHEFSRKILLGVLTVRNRNAGISSVWLRTVSGSLTRSSFWALRWLQRAAAPPTTRIRRQIRHRAPILMLARTSYSMLMQALRTPAGQDGNGQEFILRHVIR